MIKFIFAIGAVTFAFMVILSPAISIKMIFNFKRILRETLSNNRAFMRWLYGDEYEEPMHVKVYSDGWRKEDFK